MNPAPATRFAPFLLASLVALSFLGCQTPQWPVQGSLRSPFGIRSQGGADLHRGVDLEADVGTPVRPILDGRVRFTGTMEGYGNVIWVDHSAELLSVYAHLSEIEVEPLQQVSKSTVIGKTGASGNVSGPHLHLEVWRWGREVDPVQFMGRPRGE